MLCKCSGKYIDIYFNLKITFFSLSLSPQRSVLSGVCVCTNVFNKYILFIFSTIQTATFKELAPYDDDWYYTRVAAIARHIYMRSPVGVGTIRKIYGGKSLSLI